MSTLRSKRNYTPEELTFRGIVFPNMTRRQDAELSYKHKEYLRTLQVVKANTEPKPIQYNPDGSVKRGRGRPPGSLGKKKLAQ